MGADSDDGSGRAAFGTDGFDPIDFLEDAVPIASNDGVAEMRSLLVETIESNGIDARVDGAGNTLASKGAGGAEDAEEATTHLVLNTHIDTVSPHVPFSREQTDGETTRIHGRGSCDAKGPLAALLAAFFAVEPRQGARVTLAVTPDEEQLSTGAAALDLDGDLYIVGEPTGLDVCSAAKGRFQGTLTLSGTAAHAAEPESGANAVAGLEGALAAIRTFDADREAHPQLGSPTLTPTTVSGGDATNQVPGYCELVLDRRSVPPETADGYHAELTAAVREAVPDDLDVSFALTDRPTPFLEAFATDADHELVLDRRSVPPETADGYRAELTATVREAVPDDLDVSFALTDRPTPFLEAFATDADHELVRTLAAASERAGGTGVVRPFTAATEASYFSPAPVVVFGPGVLADEAGAVAHAEREYVDVADVRRAATALTDATKRLIDSSASNDSSLENP